MSLASCPSMEDIPLEDVDRTDFEYRVLMAYAERRLSASKYGRILQKEAKIQEGPSLSREQTPAAPPTQPENAPQGLPPKDPHILQKSQKKKKRSKWRRRLLPSCLCGQREDWGDNVVERGVNGQLPKSPVRFMYMHTTTEPQGIARVADRLVELIDSTSSPGRIGPALEGSKGLVRVGSLEEDGGGTSKVVPQSNGFDKEDEIIRAIVDLLRKSGDALEKQMQKDKSFSARFWDLMSYSFFRRITNQFLEEVPMDHTEDSEDQVQSMKLAQVMEVTTRLTAVDNHPMNVVLGFGTKYLKESFRPWVCSRGGWEKALGLLDQEEVE